MNGLRSAGSRGVPRSRGSALITEHLEPVRVHVREQGAEYKRLGERYNVQWTPTILVLDPEGEERHRIEGILPVDDFLSQIALGLAKSAFHRQNYADAERRYREIVDRFPSTDAAPEALYWAGVSKSQRQRRRERTERDDSSIPRSVSGHDLGEESLSLGLIGARRRIRRVWWESDDEPNFHQLEPDCGLAQAIERCARLRILASVLRSSSWQRSAPPEALVP